MRKVWLIGCGEMSQEYMKVLGSFNVPTTVIGRGESSAKNFKNVTGKKVEIGGLDSFLSKDPEVCSHAIVSVGVEKLFEVTKLLLNYGLKNILVEKPASIFEYELEDLFNLSESKKANIYRL
jgi:hypothetical protein